MAPPDVRRTVSGVMTHCVPDDSIGGEFRRTLDFLSAILDSSPDPVLVIDGSRRVSYANPAVEAMLGWSREEVLGSLVSRFVPDGKPLERIAQGLRAGGSVLRQELEALRRDGSLCWVSVSASPLRLSSRAFAGAVVFLRDETERRRTRVELARKNAELEQTVRAVSHDLRSPLVAVLGFSRLLREDYGEKLNAKGEHFLARIEQAARTMEGLIRDLLEFSRIGPAGARPPALSDPCEVLSQLQAELKPRLDGRRVCLDLPGQPPLIRCDRTRLYQIFSNLIGNALDHMGPVANPRVAVRVSEEPTQHHITVQDNGRGIDPAYHERIFEIFQVLKRGEGVTGSGIGLAIVRKIAEVHGGRAWVESQPAEGTTMHVTLARHP